jgi:hypothetical protein
MNRICRKDIENEHLRFADLRGDDKTYCPSEVARSLFPDSWRDKMNLVREVADDLIAKNKIIVFQRGAPQYAKATEAHGPIRLRKI